MTFDEITRGAVFRGILPDGLVVARPELLKLAPAEQYAGVIGAVPDLPPAMAHQHDHDIHRTPKR